MLAAVPSLAPQRAPGVYLAASCEFCGGEFLFEARSRGREDLGYPCREVRAAVYCDSCDYETTLVAVLMPPTRRRHRGPLLGRRR